MSFGNSESLCSEVGDRAVVLTGTCKPGDWSRRRSCSSKVKVPLTESLNPWISSAEGQLVVF